MAFHAEQESRDNALILRLIGSLDLGAERDIDVTMNRVAAARPRVLVVDLSYVTFLASLAMGQFVAAHRTIKGHGGVVRIAGASPDVADALRRARLDKAMPLCDSVDEALGAPV